MRFARIGDSLYGYYATPFADIRSAAEYLNTLHSGICMGQMFGGRLKPDHSLAMFHDLARSAAAETPLSSDEALHYLRREDFAPQAEAAREDEPHDIRGYALGWAKRIGNRFNNLCKIPDDSEQIGLRGQTPRRVSAGYTPDERTKPIAPQQTRYAETIRAGVRRCTRPHNSRCGRFPTTAYATGSPRPFLHFSVSFGLS